MNTIEIKKAIDDMQQEVNTAVGKKNTLKMEIVTLKKYIGENIDKTQLSDFDRSCSGHIANIIVDNPTNSRHIQLAQKIESVLNYYDIEKNYNTAEISSDICNNVVDFLNNIK